MAQQTLTSGGEQVGKQMQGNPALLQTLLSVAGALQPTMGAMSQLNPAMQLPKLAIDSAQSVLKKYYTKHAEDTLLQPGGEHVLNSLVTSAQAAQPQQSSGVAGSQAGSPAVATTAASQAPQITQQTQASQSPQDILGTIMRAIYQPGKIENGKVTGARLLGGLIGESPGALLTRQQYANLQPVGESGDFFSRLTPEQAATFSQTKSQQLLGVSQALLEKHQEMIKPDLDRLNTGSNIMSLIDGYLANPSPSALNALSGQAEKFFGKEAGGKGLFAGKSPSQSIRSWLKGVVGKGGATADLIQGLRSQVQAEMATSQARIAYQRHQISQKTPYMKALMTNILAPKSADSDTEKQALIAEAKRRGLM